MCISLSLNGEELDLRALKMEPEEWAPNGIDVAGCVQRNSREIREPEIFACAKKLRREYNKVGAVGFCYGGMRCAQLPASLRFVG